MKRMTYLQLNPEKLQAGAACALLDGLLNFFLPIQWLLSFVVVLITLDLILGCIASRKKGSGITPPKLWDSLLKLLFGLSLIMLCYTSDTLIVNIQLHSIVALLIVGFELYSIAGHMAYLSKLAVFKKIQTLMQDKVKDKPVGHIYTSLLNVKRFSIPVAAAHF